MIELAPTAPDAAAATWPRLVALDLDGTLVDAAESISPSVATAVEEVISAGVPVVLSSGRSVHAMVRVIDQLGLVDGHAVASNGSVTFTYHPVRITSSVTFDPGPAVRYVLSRVPDALIAVEVIGRGYRTNRGFPDGELTGEMWIEDVDSLVRSPVTRVIVRDPASSVEDFVALTEELGLTGINYFVGYTAWLDLAPEGVSKASGLASVCDVLGVQQGDVLAIGDGRNDLEMLRWAGRGVAMGQAPPEVRQAADDVTTSIADDGVAMELHRWF